MRTHEAWRTAAAAVCDLRRRQTMANDWMCPASDVRRRRRSTEYTAAAAWDASIVDVLIPNRKIKDNTITNSSELKTAPPAGRLLNS
jgi:hypothetical protein